jgi:hypothetical protein
MLSARAFDGRYGDIMSKNITLPLAPPFVTLARYFAALDRFDVEAIVECFSENARYGHPQVKDWQPELSTPVLHGRAAIRRFMLEYRKKQDSHHRLTGFGCGAPATGTEFVDGGNFYFATVTGRNGGYLAAVCITFEVDSQNLITRYSPHTAPPAYNLQTSANYIAQYAPAY